MQSGAGVRGFLFTAEIWDFSGKFMSAKLCILTGRLSRSNVMPVKLFEPLKFGPLLADLDG